MGDLTRRLALMRRLLAELRNPGRRVTSRELARWLGTTAETVRKDLSGTGPGTPGAAYEVEELLRRLDRMLPPRTPRLTALAGLGPFGLALAEDAGSWTFAAGFDGRTNRLETVEVPFPIYSTTEIVPVCLRLGIETAVLTVPAAETQKVAERFVQAGVRSLINYSPAVIRIDRNKVEVWEFGRPE